MIQLEHLNLVVKNMEQTLHFYQAAFPHWVIRGEGQSMWHGVPRNWLHFGDDYQYLTFNDNGKDENRDLTSHQVGLAHFAFVTNDLAKIIKQLAHAGFDIAKDGAESTFRKNCYYVDPNGYEVEFVEYLSDVPAERNLYEEA